MSPVQGHRRERWGVTQQLASAMLDYRRRGKGAGAARSSAGRRSIPTNETVVGTRWREQAGMHRAGLPGGDRFRLGAKGVVRGIGPIPNTLDDQHRNLRDQGSIPCTSTSLWGRVMATGGFDSRPRNLGRVQAQHAIKVLAQNALGGAGRL